QSVTVYSGRTHAPIYSISMPSPFTGWGFGIWSAGDLNGDHTPEIAIEGFRNIKDGHPYAFSVHDGKSGAVIFSPLGFFTSFEACGDLTGDSIPDFITGGMTSSWGFSQGIYMILSGKDGSLVRYDYKLFDTGFASSVAGLADFNGDGADDYLVGHTTS